MKALSICMQIMASVVLLSILIQVISGHFFFLTDITFLIGIVFAISLFFGGAWVGEYIERPVSEIDIQLRRKRMNNCRNGLLLCVICILILVGFMVELI